jgi:hypothetical protein
MLFLLAIVAQLSTAHAGPSEDAIRLLSRFPTGSVPEIPEVLDAVDRLAESARPDELALLESVVTHEVGAVRSSAVAAIAQIRARHGLPAPATAAPTSSYLAELTPREGSE